MKSSHALLISTFIISIFFTACGYKPSAKFSKSVLGEKVSTSVIISAQDPENSVLIKDAVDSAVIKLFHASITDRKHSDSHLNLKISNPVYSPIQYNTDGYVIAYRMSIDIEVTRFSKSKTKIYHTKGTYDFSVQPNAVVTDQERFDAIKFSSQKAIASFIAQLGAEGAREQKGK